jgi:ribosomal-protein-alanine N-acetyltransferase
MSILTPRLELRPGSAAVFAAEPHEREAFAAAIGATVPDSWPAEHYDDEALTVWRREIAQDASVAPWLIRYMIARETNVVVGIVGSGGRPSDGTFIIGYSVLPEYRRRGYASEALDGLVQWAFGHPEVARIVAYTYPELVASIGVLHKTGFRLVGDGPEERTIMFERLRS